MKDSNNPERASVSSMTVREVAQFFIKEGSEEDFKQGWERGIVHILESEGVHRAELTQGVETPTWFVLLIEWESLDAHQKFRDSEKLGKWRGEITEYFAKPPHVEHVVQVATRTP